MKDKLPWAIILRRERHAFNNYNDHTLSSGFTLFELVVVMMIMSILTAIALPTMIRQVGKARESEAKNNLSAIGFAQQGYFFEYRTFASNYADLGIRISPSYFTYPEPTTTNLITKSQALAIDQGLNGSRSFAYGTYYVIDSYRVVLCQSSATSNDTQVPDDPDGSCSNGGTRLE